MRHNNHRGIGERQRSKLKKVMTVSIKREDLIRLLREDPTLLEELRALLLTKDLLELPARTREEYRELRSILRDLLDIVRQIIDILSKVAEQTERNTLMLQEQARMLAELSEQVRENSRQIAALIEQGREHDRRLAELAEQGREFDRRLREITEHFQRQFELVHKQLNRLGKMYGQMMEIRYRQNPYGYFGEIVRRAKWVTGDELDDLLLEALSKGLINEDEQKELMRADLIVRGVREGQIAWLVVEVSGTVDTEDVDRAIRRSQLLARCVSEPVSAVVAGEFCPEEVLRYALRSGVWVLLDGSTFSPQRISRQN